MPQGVEVGNLAVRVLRLEELCSTFVFVCDLLDFGQTQERQQDFHMVSLDELQLRTVCLDGWVLSAE